MAGLRTSSGAAGEAEGPTRSSRSRAMEKSVLACFKRPSCYNCKRVDLELRARYPWVADPRETRMEAGEDVDLPLAAAAAGAGGPGGSPSHAAQSPTVNSLGSGSLNSIAQVMPKRLGSEDWPVIQPSFPWEGYPVIFDVQAPILAPPPVLDLTGGRPSTGGQSEIEECPPTPGISEGRPPAGPSPTKEDSPRGALYPVRYPRAIRTGRTTVESPDPFGSHRRASQACSSARARGERQPVHDHNHAARAARTIAIGSEKSGAAGLGLVKPGSRMVEVGRGPAPCDEGSGRFDPLYGTGRKAPLPAKSVKLVVKHDRKPTWPHPAPPFEASTLYMTRRKNKHPNLQLHIQAEAPGRDNRPARWVSEVRRAEKNIRRTLAAEDAGGEVRGGPREAGPARQADRAAEKVAAGTTARGPRVKCESADVRKIGDGVDSTKSLHTLLAAMDVAAAVASCRCSKTGAQAAQVVPGGRGQQRWPDGPRREFDLARVLRPRLAGPGAGGPFPGPHQNDSVS